MAVRFVLHRREASRDSKNTVQLCVNRASRQLKVGTSLRIDPKHWSDAKGRLRPSAPGAVEINGELERLASSVWVLSLRHPDERTLKIEILRLLGRLPEVTSPRLLDLYQTFYEEKSLRVKQSTLITYKALRAHLERAFGENASLQDVGPSFIDGFASHLLREGHENSNINKYTQRLLGFLSWLKRRSQLAEIPEREALPTARKEVVALTKAELERFAEIDLARAPQGLRNAKELFLFGALTGQRFSDLQQMSWLDLDNERWIWNLAAQKTDVVRRVPIIARAKKYLESRVESEWPLPRLSNQKANIYVKEIAQAAQLARNIHKVRRSGGRSDKATIPLHEAISFHVSRKTYVTLMLQATGDLSSVLSITHDDLKSAQHYIRTDPDLQALQAESAFDGI